MHLKFEKVLMFTFLISGLCCSAYAFAFLSNLRDAVLSAESLVGDIFKNVVQVVQQFRSFNDIFDAAVEEHCVFQCPNSKCFFFFKLYNPGQYKF